MPKFIREYVHCLADQSLIGKSGFFADSAVCLCESVSMNRQLDYGTLSDCDEGHSGHPFIREDNQSVYRFFYHDPYWELKMAVERGDVLEVYSYGQWCTLEDVDSFLNCYPNPYPLENCRIKSSGRVATYRELSCWLSQGNGEYRSYEDGDVSPYAQTTFYYTVDDENLPVQGIACVRKWGDSEWVLPTASYLGLKS